MSYAESLLAKDEQIVYEGRQHWLAPLSDASADRSGPGRVCCSW
jgi:hypothetical protein